MRTKDYANAYVKNVGAFQIIKRQWEKSVAVFKSGKCVATFRTKNEAVRFALEATI